MPTPAEISGNWLINRIVDEAERQQRPLDHEREPRLLGTSLFDVMQMGDVGRRLLLEVSRTCVPLARSAIEHAKARGAATVKVRRGLVLPQEWQDHYGRIYADETFDWVISPIMQNVFFGDPHAGETRPWKSK